MSVARYVAVALFLVMIGCGTRVVILRGGDPPLWLERMPPNRGKLCAVGFSGPTFYQQDCVKNAAENARGHLAESISVTIRTVTIDISDGTRGSYDRDVFVSGSQSASDAVLQGSEIESQWIDIQGARGEPNGCYAYVCIDPDKPLDQMVETLEKKLPPKTVEKVRENAEAAFKELEQAEQMHSPAMKPPAPPADEKKQPPPESVPAPETTTPPASDDTSPPAEPQDATRSFELPSDETLSESEK